MKKIIVLMFGFFVLCNFCQAQSPEQFVKNATKFAAAGTAENVRNAFKSTELWVKIQAKVSNVKWDVKKTDSLLTPTVAVVTATLTSSGTGRIASKELAEVSPLLDPEDELLEITYAPTKTGWQFLSGRYFGIRKVWTDIKLQGDANTFTPIRWAVEGFEVKG